HAIDHLRFVIIEEGVCHINVFIDYDTVGNVLAFDQLKGACAQDCAKRGIHTLQSPVQRELLINHRIDVALAPHDAAYKLGEESRIRTRDRFIDVLCGETQRREFMDYVADVGAGEVHLIEGLNGSHSPGASRSTGSAACAL